ncbi:MAG: DNA-binding protein [Rhodospirillaceae bacterium]
MITKTRRLTRAEAEVYLKETWGIARKKSTLAKLASVGGGPKFVKAARSVLYDPADLDTWALGLIGRPVSSTSELPQHNRA